MVCPQLQRLPAWSSAGPYVVVKSTRSDEEVSGEDHSHPPEERTGAKIQWKCSEDTHAHTHLHTYTHTHTHTHTCTHGHTHTHTYCVTQVHFCASIDRQHRQTQKNNIQNKTKITKIKMTKQYKLKIKTE